MPNVLIACAVFTTRDDTPLHTIQEAGWTVSWAPEGGLTTEDGLIDALQEQDAVIAGGEPYTRYVMENAPQLKHIARWGVGFDRVDLVAATDLGVIATTTQGGNDWGVADHAMALILGLAHRLVSNDDEVRAGTWGRPVGDDVWGATIGIVGLGRIGRGVALRAKGFNMKVLACEPYPDQAFVAQHGIELVSLPELMSRADYITLHSPGSAENKHLIGKDEIARMKPTAYIVNTARGTLIDEDALYPALVERRIAGAGLDVRELEPARDTRFNGLDNVILTSHIAGVTHGTVVSMAGMTVKSILQSWRGEKPHGFLNPEVWERRRGW
ncbi:MAG: phosphoglycerate dehydrogenase [Chloroflexota bacterium]